MTLVIPHAAGWPAIDMAVNARLWSRVKNGDKDAIKELRAKADKLVLYNHLLCVEPDDVWVNIADLYRHGVIRAIRLYTEIPAD